MDIYNPIATIELMRIEIDNLNKELTHAQTYKDDAERYRWLKNSNTDGLFIAQYNGSFSRFTGDKADEEIDQAINKSKLTKGVTNE